MVEVCHGALRIAPVGGAECRCATGWFYAGGWLTVLNKTGYREGMVVSHVSPVLASRWRFAAWAALYAVVMVYASIAVSPLGFHPADLSLADAMQKFLGTHYWENGSDQRADWTANLLLMVPLAFLLTGAVWPRRGWVWQGLAAIAALALSLAYVLGVKFVQVYFPRTVSLNYIIAQSCGAVIGVLGFVGLHGRLAQAVAVLRQGGRPGLLVALAAASLAAFAYTLVPFDLVLSRQDVAERLAALPEILLGLPGSGRSVPVRTAVLVAAALPGLPLGMLLEVWLPRRPLGLLAVSGVVAMAVLLVPALLVMGANPSLLAIPLRAAGFVAGAWGMRWIGQQDVAGARPYVRRIAPWLVLPYVLVVLALNGVLTTHWRTVADAMAVAPDPRRFIPLFTYYNIAKAQAAASLAVHVGLFAPIGVLFWAAGLEGRGYRWLTAGLGIVLAGLVEVGRWFGPGLPPEINNLWIAGLAAPLGGALAGIVWRLLVGMAREQQMPPRRASLARYL